MDLTTIKDPSFLKDLSVADLNELAFEIRQFEISHIAKTGGHLASNLGVVELTIALHYVFNSPKDKIFFDVGHQSYTHKILTGRAKDFDTLRQYNGLSGFEKFSESEHDVWEAGHSSTSLSAALGMAVARDLKGEDYCVVPVTGDGAMSSGMSLEALNQIGAEKRNIIIVFNDNNMSISKNVGALSRGFSRLRSARSYNALKENMKESLQKSDMGKVMYTGLKNFKDSVKESVIDAGIFGEFNLEYMGPVDGHNIRDLIRVLEVAKHHEGPVVVHVITQKGHGYAPCEKDKLGIWHGVGPFDVSTGKPLHKTPSGYKSWSKVASDALLRQAKNDERVIALTPAMIHGSALEDFFAKYPERSFDCGIAEEHTVTFAASLALSGMRPFVSIYSSFLQRAYDQINHDVCRMDLPVVFGIDRAGLVGEDGPTHHGVFDIGFLSPLPNLILAEGKDAKECEDLIYTAFNQSHPFAIRYPKGEVKCEEDANPQILPIGKWEVLNEAENNRVAVLSYGPEVEKILEAVTLNNLPVTVINCRFIKPLDGECITMLAHKNLPVIVYETDMLAGGLAQQILAYACDHALSIDLKRFGIQDNYMGQGAVNLLRKQEKIDLGTLFETLQKLLDA